VIFIEFQMVVFYCKGIASVLLSEIKFVLLETMFAQVHIPELLRPEELDQYLDRGWFRMGQTIFTTNFLNFKNHFYSAIWLRIPLPEFSTEKTQQKLSKKNDAFRIEIQQASITPEKEALFFVYKQNIPFEASASLQTLLFGKASHNIYNTQEINIYDDCKLIATGIFDLGKTSAAGISSIYDPAYKKYSLGKYLIYLKIAYCKKLGLEYFYPGYFVPGYSLFDYKLEIGKSALQYLEFTTSKWNSITSFNSASSPLQQMQDKLLHLQKVLLKNGVASQILYYEFFDANLIPELEGIVLFDFPIFLFCSGLSGETPVIFDVRDQQYHCVKCKSVWASTTPNTPDGLYSSHVLKLDHGIFSSEIPELMAATLMDQSKTEGKILRENLF
jgi:arginyl-tRNA--protein-N-Asp/Glu arginylyltransferase